LAASPASGETQVAADMEFSSSGQAVWPAAAGNALLIGLPMELDGEELPGTFWEFNAERTTVVEKSWKREGTILGETAFEYDETRTHLNASWASVDDVRARSYATLIPGLDSQAGGQYGFEIPRIDAQIATQSRSQFSTAFVDSFEQVLPASSATGESPLSTEHVVIPKTIVASFGQDGLLEPIEVRGNIIVTLYDMSLTIESSVGEPHELDSGHYYRNETGGAPGPVLQQGVYHEEEYRKIQLVLTNATFYLTPGARPFQVNMVSAFTAYEGDLRLRDPHGDMTVGQRTLKLDGSSVLLQDATVDVHLRPADSAPGPGQSRSQPVERVSSTIGGTVGGVLVDGRPVETTWGGAGTVDANPWLSPVLWASLPVSAALVALVVVARGRRQATDPEVLRAEAEISLLNGNFRRTLSRADRAWRLNPRDVEAASLGSIALLKLGRPAEAVQRLRDARGHVGDDEDPEGVLRLMTIIGLMEAGDRHAAEAEIREAVKTTPDLVADLLDTNLISDVKFRRTVEQLVAQGQPARADLAYG
jgi:hypothetical protein